MKLISTQPPSHLVHIWRHGSLEAQIEAFLNPTDVFFLSRVIRGWFEIRLLLRRHFRKAHEPSTRPATIETKCIEQTLDVFQEFSWPSLQAVGFSKDHSYILQEVWWEIFFLWWTPQEEECDVWSWHSISIALCSCYRATMIQRDWNYQLLSHTLTHTHQQTHIISRQSTHGCIIVTETTNIIWCTCGSRWLNFISVERCVHMGRDTHSS